VFSEVGPDGAVWFADWQNFIIQHNPTPSVERGGFNAKTGAGGAHENPLRDHTRGRIYRVVWEKAAKRALTPLNSASTAELVAALGSDVQYWRLTAQRLLVDGRKTDAMDALKAATRGADGVAALHALWTLHGFGALDEATQKAALGAKDPGVRRAAVRALPADARGQALLLGGSALSDPDLHVRLAALVKLGELPTSPEVQAAVRSLAADRQAQTDEWLREAVKLLSKKHSAVAYQEGSNLLANAGFEIPGPDGLPQGWQRRDSDSRPGSKGAEWELVTDEKLKHSGARAVRCITREAGSSTLVAEITLKPKTHYRLSAWVCTHAFGGNVSVKEMAGGHETERVGVKESGWVEVETFFNSGDKTQTKIALIHNGKGDGHFDDVKLAEVEGNLGEEIAQAGDPKRGELIFQKHPAVACILCHSLKGQGSTVGPPLDGIASRKDAKYIVESLLEPNKVLAQGFEHIGASPMPPMGLILKPQELADIEAFLQTLK
jgi:mono/diheme cytochrome c family protein